MSEIMTNCFGVGLLNEKKYLVELTLTLSQPHSFDKLGFDKTVSENVLQDTEIGELQYALECYRCLHL